jgi:outer membrane protein OmpA-like peptidoglycan-associated protein
MRPKANRLLMLLIGASLAGCASQTERSSSGGGAESTVEFERVGGTSNVVTREELERRAAAEAAAAAATSESPQAQSAADAAPSEPEYEPQREEVQYIDKPLEEAPVTAAAPPPPASTASADEPLPDFPITKYEIEEPAEQAEQADAQSEEIEDLGTQPDESTTAGSAEEPVTTGESTVGEPTVYPDEPEEIAAAEEPSEVEDLGTQPDESGAETFAEEERESSGSAIGDPTVYPDEPVQQAAAPTTPSVSVNFEAEPLFSFDKAVIRRDQRTALDEFVASLQDVEYDEISAVGHADKIGSEGYNEGLSERRANAVKDYLVTKGIAADKIRIEARGETEPVTADTCSGKRGKALIACLQPDRRVDVTVTGSKSD